MDEVVAGASNLDHRPAHADSSSNMVLVDSVRDANSPTTQPIGLGEPADRSEPGSAKRKSSVPLIKTRRETSIIDGNPL